MISFANWTRKYPDTKPWTGVSVLASFSVCPLRGDGALKVLQGITSVAEVLRATEDEGNVVQS